MMTEVAVSGDLNTVGADEKNKNKDPTKHPTFAEKLVGVRNSQCEHYLQRTQDKLDHDELRNMQKIREDTNRITYDLKTMKVMKKKRELELKRQRNPYLDTEQDEFEIVQAERYLVFNPNICFYTNKKNRYPLRSLAKLDPYHTTPTISKARKVLQDMVTERRVHDMQSKRAEMYSRRSIYSVRFQSPEYDEADGQTTTSHHRYVSSQSHSRNLHSPYTHVSNNRLTTNTPDESRGEALLDYLRKQKQANSAHGTDKYATLNDENEIPDDFTQCAPTNQAQSSNHDTEDVFQLPSVTSDERIQMYVNSEMGPDRGPQFEDLNKDLPPHEVILLTQAASQPVVRQTKSASAATRTVNQTTQMSRRQASTSAASSIKRKQYTHAMMRKENKNVEAKVNYFLKTFENGKRRTVRYHQLPTTSDENRPESRQTVTFKTPKEERPLQKRSRSASPDKFLGDPTSAINAHYGTLRRASTAVSRPSMGGQINANESKRHEKEQRTPGVPFHSEKRSNRNSATFKLRNLVKELMKNRTKQQIMEYEKMKMGLTDDQTPELE